MKKILFYINSIHYGGAERVIVNLANEFSKRNYKVVFVTSFKDNKEYILDESIERITLEENNLKKSFIKKNIFRTLNLRKVYKHHKPNIVISFMAEPNFRAIAASMFLNIKNIISVRNDPNKAYPNILYRIVARILYPFADGCVFQTDDAKKWFSNSIQKKSKIIL
jgi:UDP-N-acetylglucosamine:LPS N-acetylglucosamine transferase